jgi:hypothetical protein
MIHVWIGGFFSLGLCNLRCGGAKVEMNSNDLFGDKPANISFVKVFAK